MIISDEWYLDSYEYSLVGWEGDPIPDNKGLVGHLFPVKEDYGYILDLRYKENVYKLWPHIEKYGRIERLSELCKEGSSAGDYLALFGFIGGCVLHRNVAYVNLRELEEVVGCSSSSRKRGIKHLQDVGLLEEAARNLDGVGSRVYYVHPRYFWVGSLAANQWASVRWLHKMNLRR